MRLLYVFFITGCLLIAGCDKFEYSPNQVSSHNTPTNLNQKNIARLQSTAGDDTIRVILTGDTQRSYDNDEEFVAMANTIPNVDFVLLAGDISDFGLLREFEKVNKIYEKLYVPYIGVIGNHDMQGNGNNVFEKMYGALNFSFLYKGIKFVGHNTCSRESNFDNTVPDMTWLRSEFANDGSVNGYVAVAHVPPYSSDFDERLEAEYAHTLNTSGKLLTALYAHVGSTEISYPYDEDGHVPYITTGGLDNRQFMIVEIIHGKVTEKIIAY